MFISYLNYQILYLEKKKKKKKKQTNYVKFFNVLHGLPTSI